MKITHALLIVSLLANVALGGRWLLGTLHPAGDNSRSRPSAPSVGPPPDPGSARSIAVRGKPVRERDDSVALRERLRALGFSERMVRAGVRAHLEAPRLARERAVHAEITRQPWWRPGAMTLEPPAAMSPAVRELRKAERDEITRVLGPAGTVTAVEIERFAFLPDEKAAHAAALMRDFLELRREITSPGAPVTRAEAFEREKLLTAELDRDFATLLTPEERDEVEMRTSTAAFITSHNLKHFEGTEAEIRALYELQRGYHDDQEAARVAPMEARGRSTIDRSQKFQRDLEAALGAERYAQYHRAQQEEYTMLSELQRRFAIPQTTLDAVAATTRQISDEGMRIARDETRSREERVRALRDLADDARHRVRVILGDDLGDAYNVGSARGWLDHLERGSVPFLLPNGQRAIFGVAPPGRARTPPRK